MDLEVSLLDEIIQTVIKVDSRTKGIYLFGSFADGTSNDSSDIDIAILVLGGLSAEQKLQLAATFVKNIPRKVDVVDFVKADTVLQYEIVSKGKLIFDNDYIFNANNYLKTLGIYHDHIIETRELREEIMKNMHIHG